MTKLSSILIALFLSQLAFAGGTDADLLAQAKGRVTTKRGAHARNELAYRLLTGVIDEGVALDFETSALQLMQVISAHDAETNLGARARILLSSSRLSNLIADDIVGFEEVVGYLHEVVQAFDASTREGAAARNNLAFTRIEEQVGDDLVTLEETRRHLQDVLNDLPQGDDEVSARIIDNARLHFARLPAEPQQEQEPEVKKIKVEPEEEALPIVPARVRVIEPPPPLPMPDLPLEAPQAMHLIPPAFWGFNAIMPVVFNLMASSRK